MEPLYLLAASAPPVLLTHPCVRVFLRELGGEAVLREAVRGALSAQRERHCLSHRGLRHHAAGMWHAGGGQSQQTHHIRPPDEPGLRSEPLVCPKALLTLKTRPTGALRALLSLSGLIQSRSFGLQTEEVESVSGLRRAGRSGVLSRPSRHRRSAL